MLVGVSVGVVRTGSCSIVGFECDKPVVLSHYDRFFSVRHPCGGELKFAFYLEYYVCDGWGADFACGRC
jgi:hypothetical protein